MNDRHDAEMDASFVIFVIILTHGRKSAGAVENFISVVLIAIFVIMVGVDCVQLLLVGRPSLDAIEGCLDSVTLRRIV